MSDNSEIKFKAIGNNRNRNTREQTRTSHSNISATKERQRRTEQEKTNREAVRQRSASYEIQRKAYSSTTSAKSRRKKQPSRQKRAIGGIGFLIIMSFILTAVIFVVGKFGKLNENSQKDGFNEAAIETNELNEDTKSTLQGFKTIAIFGVDKKDDDITIESGVNSDVNMIAAINYDTHQIRLVSVYRDTYVNVNEKTGEYNKLNSAYKDGGPQQALNTLNRNLDLALTDYVTVDWAAVADVINDLGGIDLDIDETELYWINGYITDVVKNTNIASTHLKTTGPQHVDGVQAVAYCRIRYGGGDDFRRTERQRIVLEKILQKVKQTDLLTLNKIIDRTLEKISTNLEIGEILQLAKDITKYQITDTTGFPAEKYALFVDGVSYVFPATLERNVKTLHEFLFGSQSYVPSNKLKEISSHIIEFSGVDETFDMHDAIEAEKQLESVMQLQDSVENSSVVTSSEQMEQSNEKSSNTVDSKKSSANESSSITESGSTKKSE